MTRRRARLQAVDLAQDQPDGGGRNARRHLAGRFVRADRDGFHVDHVAGIRFLHHDVQRDAGFAFAVNDRPVERGATAIARQQRAMHVVGAEPREFQNPLGDHLAVVEGKDEVRREGANEALDRVAILRLLRIDGNAVRARQRGTGSEPLALVRRVFMREERLHLLAARDERLEAGMADLAIGEDDNSLFRGFAVRRLRRHDPQVFS